MKLSVIFSTLSLVLLNSCQKSAWSFSIGTSTQQRQSSSTLLAMHNHNDKEDSRRGFLTKAATVAAVGLGSPFLPMDVANAVTGVQKVNSRLKGFGLPQVNPKDVAGGYTPLLEVYGKGKNRSPILVQFQYPLSWVVTLPSNDQNGEDGTVQAGDYAKGDTATFFVYEDPGKVKIADAPKSLLEKAVTKAISQKGDNMYQSFKVIKTEPVTYDGQDYVLVDFKYELLTGAGFIVDRRGVASVTSQGNSVQVLWAATISQRFKKLEDTLRYITKSFRCYTEGIQFGDELQTYDSLE